MAKNVLRFLLILICSVSGFFVFQQMPQAGEHRWLPWLGSLVGASVAGLAILIERLVRRVPLKLIIGGTLGLFVGLVLARLLSFVFEGLNSGLVGTLLYVMLSVFFGYLGLVLGQKKIEEVGWTAPGSSTVASALSYLSRHIPRRECPKVVDTSAIIDGRLYDICATGFVDGPLIIPRFVLEELQYIADSTDPIKRTRGRRGLELLERLQEEDLIEVRIVDQDYPQIKETDAKLIALAKDLQAKLITTDYNLNKVARLQGVPVMNVNELANALKPVLIPGESLKVTVLKEGKEPNQGVAYLEDGTMVVIENGRRLIGQEIEAVVTSVLQTPAGRIIFVQPKSESLKEVVSA